MPIKISVVDDVSSFLRGAGRVEDALDRVGDSLDDVAREADRAGDDARRDLGDGFDRAGDDVQDATRRMERSFLDMARTAKRQSAKAGDDLGDNMKRGTRRAERATDEFKDEAKSNLSEVASSFKGDMDSVADLAQGTFGGLASMGGPIGLAAAGIAALGGGFYAAWSENAEKVEARVQSMYDDMLESGQNFLSDSFIQEQINAIVSGADDAVVAYDRAVREAETLGVSSATVIAAYAGQKDALDDVDAAFQKVVDRAMSGDAEIAAAAADQLWDLQEMGAALGDLSTKHQEVADKVEVAREAAYRYTSQYGELKDALDESVGYYGGRTFTTTVKVDADTAAADRAMSKLLSKRYEATAYINTRPGVKYW